MPTDVDFLLDDERPGPIAAALIERRSRLLEEFRQVPAEALEQLQYFQPQVGCYNRCAFCSQHAGTTVWQMSTETLRDVVWVLRERARELSLGVARARGHKPGVLFPYVDNDIGSYEDLLLYARLCHKELGCAIRITSVGFSRFNSELQQMHSAVANLPDEVVAGVRLSFTPWTWGYTQAAEHRAPGAHDSFINDFANVLRTYRARILSAALSRDRMAVELRFPPHVANYPVDDDFIGGHHCIRTGPHLLVSELPRDTRPRIGGVTSLEHPPARRSPLPIWDIDPTHYRYVPIASAYKRPPVDAVVRCGARVAVYRTENSDGPYYAALRDEDLAYNWLNIYPDSRSRKPGYNDTERVFLSALLAVKAKHGIGRREEFDDASEDDIALVLDSISRRADDLEDTDADKADYIRTSVVPLVTDYAAAFTRAELPARLFFSRDFTVDTGQIVNQGRARHLFKDLVSATNEPVTAWEQRTNLVSGLKHSIWRLAPAPTGDNLSSVVAGAKNLPADNASIVLERLAPEGLTNVVDDGERLQRFVFAVRSVTSVGLSLGTKAWRLPGLVPERRDRETSC